MLLLRARRVASRPALRAVAARLSPPFMVQASPLCTKLPEAPWKSGSGGADAQMDSAELSALGKLSDKLVAELASAPRATTTGDATGGTTSQDGPKRGKERSPEQFVPPTFPEDDMCNPPGVTDDELRAFLFERWDLAGGQQGKGKNWNPRRRLYKLQRAMQVDGVWPLESLAPQARLVEKEKLLHSIHRLAAHGLPDAKDEDGHIIDVLLHRRVRSVSMLAALSHRELLEDTSTQPKQEKRKPRGADNGRPGPRGDPRPNTRGSGYDRHGGYDRSTIAATMDRRND